MVPLKPSAAADSTTADATPRARNGRFVAGFPRVDQVEGTGRGGGDLAGFVQVTGAATGIFAARTRCAIFCRNAIRASPPSPCPSSTACPAW